MRVLITGGTGYVGGHTTSAALRAGHHVRLLVRDPARIRPAIGPLGHDADEVESIVGDATDPESVAKAVHGVDAVIHLASVFSMDSRDAKRVLRTGARATPLVLDQAVKAGADPVVYASSYAALLPSDVPLSTESPAVPPAPGRPAYFAAQSLAEQHARDLQAGGAPVVIVNLLATLGPHDPHLGDQLTRLRNAAQHRLRFMPHGGFSINDVRDVARLLVATLEPGQGPRRFIPGGHRVSTREYIAAVGHATGRPWTVMYPPMQGVMPLCRAVDVLQHIVPWHIPAEYAAAYMCQCDARIDASMPRTPLGVAARPLTETIGDSLRWLHKHGHLSARQAGLAVQGPAVP